MTEIIIGLIAIPVFLIICYVAAYKNSKDSLNK
jgi:hypothetical protein